MGHEISQFDIPDHQLLATNAQQREGVWKDIGEAKITHTIFGKVQVRVIRKRDKKRRAWLLTMLVVVAIAATAWQGWIALQKSELFAPPLPLNERIRVSAPVFEPENIPATPPSVRDRQRTQTQILIDSMATRRPPKPQQPHDLKAAEQIAAKPVAAQPLIASKPAPLATNNNSSKNQADMQQPAKLPATIQPVAPAVATPPAAQPAANKPTAAAPLAEPIKKDTSTSLPAGGNQPSGPVNAQP